MVRHWDDLALAQLQTLAHSDRYVDIRRSLWQHDLPFGAVQVCQVSREHHESSSYTLLGACATHTSPTPQDVCGLNTSNFSIMLDTFALSIFTRTTSPAPHSSIVSSSSGHVHCFSRTCGPSSGWQSRLTSQQLHCGRFSLSADHRGSPNLHLLWTPYLHTLMKSSGLALSVPSSG